MRTTYTSAALLACLAAATPAAAQYSVTILHHGDGESALSRAGEFATLLNQSRDFYTGLGHGVVSVYAGDSIIPGPEFQASLDSGDPGSRTFFDAIALDLMGYDAVAVGNHEFDAGPAVFAEFLQATSVPFVSANLDFSGEASLAGLVGTDLFKSTTVNVPVTTPGGVVNKTIGIVGATTPNLPFVTSVGGVVVNDVLTSVNAEVAALKGAGVDHIVMIDQLQGIGVDLDLVNAGLSTDIDLIVSGGGEEISADLGAASPASVHGAGAPLSVVDTGLLPGDSVDRTAFPDVSTAIPVVTTGADLRYLGRITLNFDDAGNLTGFDPSSNPQANTGFDPDPAVQTQVVEPVEAFIANLGSNVLAQSSITLLGNSDRDVIRANEAPLGNLVADGLLAAATDAADDFGVKTPDLAFVNGGGIRDDIDAGPVSQLTSFDISPFGNIVSIVEDVTRDDVKLIFENAYSKVTDDTTLPGINPIRDSVDGTGRFLHVSEGVEIVYDITAQALELDLEGNLVTPGGRVQELVVNGETIVTGGEVVPGDALTIATLDFLLNGGDQIFEDYLSQNYSFTRVGLTDQNALQAFIEGLAGGDTSFDLAGDPRFDAIPDGRITAVPEPASLALLGLGLALAAPRRR